jgi:hypothetical protein
MKLGQASQKMTPKHKNSDEIRSGFPLLSRDFFVFLDRWQATCGASSNATVGVSNDLCSKNFLCR